MFIRLEWLARASRRQSALAMGACANERHVKQEGTMNRCVIAGALAALFAFAGSAAAQVNDKPWEENWWPSKWGADDSAGSSNHTKNPANVKRALSVVKQFKVVTIGRVYHREMPNFGVRSWNLTIPVRQPAVRSARTD